MCCRRGCFGLHVAVGCGCNGRPHERRGGWLGSDASYRYAQALPCAALSTRSRPLSLPPTDSPSARPRFELRQERLLFDSNSTHVLRRRKITHSSSAMKREECRAYRRMRATGSIGANIFHRMFGGNHHVPMRISILLASECSGSS